MYSEVVVQEVWQRRWEPWSWEAQWPAIGSWQLATESIIEADRSSYNYRRSCWRTQRRPFYGGLHLKQIGKVKKLNKWVPQELTKNKKKLAFLSVISFYSVQQWSDCDVLQNVNCIQLPTMTSSMAGLRRSSSELPKAKFAPKKGCAHYLVVFCLSDPLELSESWWDHYIWEVCSANQWDTLKTSSPEACLGKQKGSNSFPW